MSKTLRKCSYDKVSWRQIIQLYPPPTPNIIRVQTNSYTYHNHHHIPPCPSTVTFNNRWAPLSRCKIRRGNRLLPSHRQSDPTPPLMHPRVMVESHQSTQRAVGPECMYLPHTELHQDYTVNEIEERKGVGCGQLGKELVRMKIQIIPKRNIHKMASLRTWW